MENCKQVMLQYCPQATAWEIKTFTALVNMPTALASDLDKFLFNRLHVAIPNGNAAKYISYWDGWVGQLMCIDQATFNGYVQQMQGSVSDALIQYLQAI